MFKVTESARNSTASSTLCFSHISRYAPSTAEPNLRHSCGPSLTIFIECGLNVSIEPEYEVDTSGVPELANDFPIYEEGIEWLEIYIENEREERLILSFYLDNKEGVQVKLNISKENISLYFKGDVSMYKSVIKLMYRYPETIKKYHWQYRMMMLKEAGLI